MEAPRFPNQADMISPMIEQKFPLESGGSGLNRRRLLQVAGLGVGGLLFGAGSRAEAFSGSPGEVRPGIGAQQGVTEIPDEWLQRERLALRTYAPYLTGLRLKSMSVGQIVAAHAKKRGEVWNVLPPRDMWSSIVPTLRVIDALALQLGMPVAEVVSVYRMPAYNARCEGARSGSWHTRNVAVDIKMAAPPSVVAATARSLRARGLFSGGVGRYSNFVHIDTRGTNFDW